MCFFISQFRLDSWRQFDYPVGVMSTAAPTLDQRLKAAREQMAAFDALRKEAFQPAPAMPQGGAPPMDPAMMQQGAPPMDPAMMQQGAPPMDPAMMQQGGAPPMDPAMAPPSIPPEQFEEMMQLLEQMAQGLQQAMQRIEQLEAGQQEIGQGLEEVTQTISSAMQPPVGGEPEAAPAGGW